jgi:uncharacterized membrane protein YhfC
MPASARASLISGGFALAVGAGGLELVLLGFASSWGVDAVFCGG